MNRIKVAIIAIFAGVSLVGLIGVSYLAFVFPKTIEIWKEQGQKLSAPEQLLVNVSMICQKFGLILIPAYLLATIGFSILAAIAIQKSKKSQS